MEITIKKTRVRWLLGLFGLALVGCSTAENEMAGGNLKAVNHTLHAINWFSVNGYRAHGGGGSTCCIVLPTKWRPGLKANIEWEVDPEPYAKIKRKTTGYGFDEDAWAAHEAKFQRHNTIVDIPEWSGTDSCGLSVHFLTCNKIKVTTSCWGYGSPNNPIKEPKQMKEPAVCPK
ncbi:MULTISPECIES: DUF3304 domain-containing protein [unclassified Pseudomonas]|uniref:DUF3304 domain-containing protein n=2 Tax=unclassified Pseudomonas TaxID=196821 RepID=UPI000C8863D0|nr:MULTISPECIES: DUF3304 domain-containing protein [unclassified Pseudomonas]PMZ85367.1 hypothetical protein C1X61_27960 [Pseudomonas sp. FW215-T2]PNB33828.1 hypothetical protein C1X63_28530 [Pseudomonas sp. FW305-131]